MKENELKSRKEACRIINVIYMAKQTYSSLESLKYLVTIKNIKIVCAVIREKDTKLRNLCNKYNIDICRENELKYKIQEKRIEIDYIFSYYWKKISIETLKICTAGINFHPGPLPEARGSGYHIAILENWGYWGVTAHYMDEEYDTGDIIKCKKFSIPVNIVNIDLVRMAHKNLVELFIEIVDKIRDGELLPCEKQNSGCYYDIKEVEKIKMISDMDDRDVIERKIRAFWNPPYKGAQVNINGIYYTLVNDEILKWVADHVGLE